MHFLVLVLGEFGLALSSFRWSVRPGRGPFLRGKRMAPAPVLFIMASISSSCS